MNSLVFSPIAREDIKRIYRFMAHDSSTAAKRAIERIKSGTELLIKYPSAGYDLAISDDVRELLLPFGRGNFVVRYQVRATAIVILHIWHNRENPDSFKS